MIKQKGIAEKSLQTGAVQLRPDEPIHGRVAGKATIYCDNRKILSFPHIQDYIKSEMCNFIFKKYSEADLVGVKYQSLTDYATLINIGLEKGKIQSGAETLLLQWRKDPAHWQGI
ncbi:MAG: hypothetical protein WKG06_28485 [Segetibacter sp.]